MTRASGQVILGVNMKCSCGVGTHRNLTQAIKEALAQAKASLPVNNCDAAIIFSTPDCALPMLPKTVRAALGEIPVVGATSPAIIANTRIIKHGLLVLLLSLGEGEFLNTALSQQNEHAPAQEVGEKLGAQLLYGLQNIKKDIGIIFSEGLGLNNSEVITGIQKSVGLSFPLVGAAVSDPLTRQQTHIYFNDALYTKAAGGIMLGGKVHFGWGIKHGWKPIGKPRRITKSDHNIVWAIDGGKASRIYEEYFARNIHQLQKEVRRISTFYPLGIRVEGEEEYLLRNIVSFERDGSIVFQGAVPQDSQIRLMIGTKESCLQATQDAIWESKQSFTGHALQFMLIFNSLSRYQLLGRLAEKELLAIASGIGTKVPLVGLYTGAEEAPLRSINYLGKAYAHNQTITLLGLGT